MGQKGLGRGPHLRADRRERHRPSARKEAQVVSAPTAEQQHLDLPVSGMTCAGCAKTIEKGLSSAPGVSNASVNFATGIATVDFDPRLASPEALARIVEQLGYHVPAPAEDTTAAEEKDYRDLRRRFLVAAVLAAPVAILGMAHGAFPFPRMHWVELLLTAPIAIYSGAPFYRAAASALRRGAANMNTLVTLGAGSAFLYSTVVTVWPGLLGHDSPVYF